MNNIKFPVPVIQNVCGEVIRKEPERACWRCFLFALIYIFVRRWQIIPVVSNFSVLFFFFLFLVLLNLFLHPFCLTVSTFSHQLPVILPFGFLIPLFLQFSAFLLIFPVHQRPDQIIFYWCQDTSPLFWVAITYTRIKKILPKSKGTNYLFSAVSSSHNKIEPKSFFMRLIFSSFERDSNSCSCLNAVSIL